MARMQVWGVEGFPELHPGDNLGELIVAACAGEPNGPLATEIGRASCRERV